MIRRIQNPRLSHYIIYINYKRIIISRNSDAWLVELEYTANVVMKFPYDFLTKQHLA